MRFKMLARLLALPLMLLAGSAFCSYPLMIHFDDPEGDFGGTIDVTGMVMRYDNATGDYEISLSSTAENPFVGTFRVDINLFNPDTGTSPCSPSRFAKVGNDYNLDVPAQRITIVGNNRPFRHRRDVMYLNVAWE